MLSGMEVDDRFDYERMAADYSLTLEAWDAFVRELLVEAWIGAHASGCAPQWISARGSASQFQQSATPARRIEIFSSRLVCAHHHRRATTRIRPVG